MRKPLIRAAVPVLALAGCNAPQSSHVAPESVGSIFEYLAAKYDHNGDGAVDPAEYARESEGFARLDSNSDGKLTAEDFPAERWERDLGIRDMPPEMRERAGARYAARAVVLAYFRADSATGDPALSREGLEQAFARLDHDASGALDATEFARATDAVPWGGPGEAWEILRTAIDVPSESRPSASEDPGKAEAEAGSVRATPGDGLVALDEFLRYHAGMAGKDGLLRGPPGVDPLAAAPGLAGDGPPVGSFAPDFDLEPPEGGARVRLSSWRGKRPVALIFGSYT